MKVCCIFVLINIYPSNIFHETPRSKGYYEKERVYLGSIGPKKCLVPITLPYLVSVPYLKVFLPILQKNELFLPKNSLSILNINSPTIKLSVLDEQSTINAFKDNYNKANFY